MGGCEIRGRKVFKASAAVLLAAASLTLLALASPAQAATITVNITSDVTADDGACTLREAIVSANTDTASRNKAGECAAGSGPDLITFSLPSGPNTITLSGEQLEIISSVNINGPGAEALAVSGDDASRVFLVDSGSTVGISGLSVTGGNSGAGGGIFNGGTLTVKYSTISDNGTNHVGGGIFNSHGTLTVKYSTISGNNANSGGGILNSHGTLTVEDSTISENSAEFGGGIHSFTGITSLVPEKRATIRNSTISDNTSSNSGGGVRNSSGLTVIENSTITDNTAPGDRGSGVASYGDTPTRTEVFSSIIAGNAKTDVDFIQEQVNSFQSNGYNLIGDGNATGAFDQSTDQTDVNDPLLGPLADNGGSTRTHAVEEGSPALDQGDAGSKTTDQRGESRPLDFPNVANASGGDGSDIGAFEAQFLPPPDDNSGGNNGGGNQPPANPNARTITGTPGNDILRGTNGRDVICGLDGNDIIYGLGGNDVLRGGAGNDTIYGGDGLDRIEGANGNDALYGERGNDTILGGKGNDALRGGPGKDTLDGGPGRNSVKQ